MLTENTSTHLFRHVTREAAYNYDYDANGNVVGLYDLRPGGNENRILTYDGLNRMITAHGPELLGFEYYGYDALDNLRSASFTGSARADLHINWQMNAANRLASIHLAGLSHLYSHDARGNHTSGLSTALVPYTRHFNARNQLTSVNLPGQSDVYRYDGQTHQPSFGPSPAKTRGSSVLLIRTAHSWRRAGGCRRRGGRPATNGVHSDW